MARRPRPCRPQALARQAERGGAAGRAAARRCAMAAPPPASAACRTTGSTCLRPFSELLRIPLDQLLEELERLEKSKINGYKVEQLKIAKQKEVSLSRRAVQ